MKLNTTIMKVSILVLFAAVARAQLAPDYSSTSQNGTVNIWVGSNNGFNPAITIEFVPNLPAPLVCGEIHAIQACRITRNGSPIAPGSADGGSTEFDHLDNDVTSSGWFIDHKFCERDKYMTGDDEGQDTDEPGSWPPVGGGNGSLEVNDMPSLDSGCVAEFETCFVCVGPAGSHVIACVRWIYTQNSNGTGTISFPGVLGPQVSTTSSPEFDAACALFESNHLCPICQNENICPEDLKQFSIRSNGQGLYKADGGTSVIEKGSENVLSGSSIDAAFYSAPISSSLPGGRWIDSSAGIASVKHEGGSSPYSLLGTDLGSSLCTLVKGKLEVTETGIRGLSDHLGVVVATPIGEILYGIVSENSTDLWSVSLFDVTVDEAQRLTRISCDELSNTAIKLVSASNGSVQIITPGQIVNLPWHGAYPGNATNAVFTTMTNDEPDPAFGLVTVRTGDVVSWAVSSNHVADYGATSFVAGQIFPTGMAYEPPAYQLPLYINLAQPESMFFFVEGIPLPVSGLQGSFEIPPVVYGISMMMQAVILRDDLSFHATDAIEFRPLVE